MAINNNKLSFPIAYLEGLSMNGSPGFDSGKQIDLSDAYKKSLSPYTKPFKAIHDLVSKEVGVDKFLNNINKSPSNWSKFNNFAGGTVGQAINVGTSLVANAVGNRAYEGKEGHITQGMDSAYDTVQSAISNIPGFGQAAGMIMGANKMLNNVMSKIGGGTDGVTKTDAILGSAFLAPIGWINGFGGKTANTYTRNQELDANTNGGFLGFLTTQNLTEIGAGKKYGLFSRGAMNKLNKLTEFTLNMKHTVSGIVDANTINTLAAQGSTPFVANQQSVDIGGGVQQMRAAKLGMKFGDLASVKRALSLYRVGGLISGHVNDSKIQKKTESKRLPREMNVLISYANRQNPPFIKRILDNDTRSIVLPDGKNATHLLSYGEADDKFYVYPKVQDINGLLVLVEGDALKEALKNRNVLEMLSEDEAKLFTEQYKKYYPNFFQLFKQGGKVNVIPEGALHARLHHLDEVDETLNEKNITTKGIPVITQEEGGEIVLHAEIEREEIIFNIDVTNKLEKLRKENTDESAIEAGKLLVDEIMNNTIDNTGNLI